MHDWVAAQVRYDDERRQMAWVNDEGWAFAPPARSLERRQRARAAVAHALRRLATLLDPTPTVPVGLDVSVASVGR